MTEVFKTNVCHRYHAGVIAQRIRDRYVDYAVSFDLEDCDHILRVQSSGNVDAGGVIDILHRCGFEAEVLPDVLPPRMPLQ